MFFWQQFPFLRIVIFFILGISIAYHYSFSIPSLYAILFTLLLIYCALYWKSHKNVNMRISSFQGATFLFLTLIFGMIYFVESNEKNKPDENLYSNDVHSYLAFVATDSEEKGKNYRAVLEVVKVKTEGGWKASSGKVQVYIATDIEDNRDLNYGCLVLIKGRPQTVPPPANPEEFNYQQYLKNQNIYFQHFINRNQYNIVEKGAVKGFKFYTSHLRRKAIAIIKANIHRQHEQAIALAMILGLKSEINADLQHNYQVSGAMHVLAVSGLHVGMIYSIILLIFGWIKKIQGGKLVFAGIALGFLWLYAGVTGMPASVVRAVTMFSVVIISQSFNRQSNIYNSLAIAALLILLYDPASLFSVGFQLSFVAVLGIVYIYPKLYHKVNPSNYLLDKIWALTCISIAAQLATFPISMYYFHQFPVYFFLSNLLVIPAAYFILCTGLAMLAASFWGSLSAFLGNILEWGIWLTNQLIYLLKFLPYHLVEGVFFSVWQVFFIYVFVFFITLFFHFKKLRYLKLAFFAATLFFIVDNSRLLQQKAQQKLVVYHVNKFTVVDFINGNSFYTYTGGVQDNSDKIDYHVKPYRLTSGLIGTGSSNIPQKKVFKDLGNMDLLLWNNKKVLVINELNKPFYSGGEKKQIDLVLIRNNSVKNLRALKDVFECGKIVLDGSNNYKYAASMEKEAKFLDLELYSTLTQGALVIIEK